MRISKAIQAFRDLPDDALVCPVCNKSRPPFEVKSLGAAMRAVNEDFCWFTAEACAATGDGPRIFMSDDPDFHNTVKNAESFCVVRVAGGKRAMMSRRTGELSLIGMV
jgi:hypothetical protein